MRFLVLTDGKRFERLEWPQGVNPDTLIEKSYPGWILIGPAPSEEEAAALIKDECSRRRADSY